MSVVTCKRCKKQVNYQKGMRTENFLCYACMEKIKMMSRVIEASKNDLPMCELCNKRKASHFSEIDGEKTYYCQNCLNVLNYEYDNWEKKEVE